MPRWKENVPKYAYLLWRSGLALCLVACIGLVLSVWLSGGSETEDAVESGRRLVIALDTGEVKGKVINLDGTSPSPVPPAEKAPEPPAEKPPEPAAAPPVPGAPSETAPAETPPPVLPPEVKLPPATPTAEPNPALMEQTEAGMLPVIGKDGTKPWRYYSKPYERKRNQPMVAIIVTGLGEGRAVTQQALTLPEYVAFSFSPYARDIPSWSTAVRATGHELLIDLPLEPTNYPATDPGPYGLLLDKGSAEAEKRLQWVMARYPAYIGMMTPQNESFTANDEAFKLLLQSMANRGLLMVVGGEPHKKETRDIIDGSHTAILVADVLIDEELSPLAIQTRFGQLVDRAKNQGYAIGVLRAYPLSISELQAWMAALEEKGVMLVPVSAIAKLRFS